MTPYLRVVFLVCYVLQGAAAVLPWNNCLIVNEVVMVQVRINFVEGWNAKLWEVNRHGGACVLLQCLTPARDVLGRVGSCAASPALLPLCVRWRAGEAPASCMPSPICWEEGHLMETGRLGCYLYQEWGLEKKVLMCYPKTDKDQWELNLTK